MSTLADRQRPARGIFDLRILRNGIVIERYRDENLVVDVARTQMAHLIGGDVSGRSIEKIAFGTNGSEPHPGNTVITNPYIKPVSAIAYPSSNSVEFTFELRTDEANGMSIVEFGLLTGSEALFARKVRTGAIQKEPDLSLSGTWTVLF